MQVFSPGSVAKHTGSKYLGVLVAARYGRELNALPREAVPAGLEIKLTTRAIEALVRGNIKFELVKRRQRGA
jgi:DNA-directed RNA polymerase subunit K/omega